MYLIFNSGEKNRSKKEQVCDDLLHDFIRNGELAFKKSEDISLVPLNTLLCFFLQENNLT